MEDREIREIESHGRHIVSRAKEDWEYIYMHSRPLSTLTGVDYILPVLSHAELRTLELRHCDGINVGS